MKSNISSRDRCASGRIVLPPTPTDAVISRDLPLVAPVQSRRPPRTVAATPRFCAAGAEKRRPDLRVARLREPSRKSAN